MATRCSSALRAIARTHRVARALASSSRCLATATATDPSSPPPPPAPIGAADPKLNKIVDDISGLTLLQAADLVALLKSRLNIQEIAMPAAAPAAAPAQAEAEAPEEKPKEKTMFNVTLESFDAAVKPKIIREVKAMIPNLTLIEAKKFVESLPQTLKTNVNKEDAQKLEKTFKDIGAVVKLD
ncbi:hypothetical protein EVJ58_g2425 [Rhodofomes roseus]|uniref:50S ribosomal protein L7/L12 n=1 Tax=Rhodofomes roseus TaxID=34475 RepID=A0A4Y9YSM7_9APHY|nr:hypothetical protein EVJ58_g2425 [Rhodofomes roseus]